MDYDVLLRIARCAIKGILSQDTTDYWETLDTDAILVVNTNPQAGDIRTAATQMAQIWDDNIELKRRQLEATLQSNRTMLTAERAQEEEKMRQMVNRPKIELIDLEGLGQELARGAEHVGRATLSVFEWMHKWASKTGGIAQPQSKQEVRRRKEGTAKSSSAAAGATSGFGSIGGGMTSPSSSLINLSPSFGSNRQQRLREEAVKAQLEAAAAGRTLEGKLGFSSITLTYGLPHMLVRDELYVHEDGKVVLVIRTPLAPEEGYYPEILQARNAAVVDVSGGGTIPVIVDPAAAGATPQSGRRSMESPRSSATLATSPRNRSTSSKNDHHIIINSNTSLVVAAGGKQQQQQQQQPGPGATLATTSTAAPSSPRGVVAKKHVSTASATNSGSKILDFSFKKVTQPYDLLRTEPANFVRHIPAPVAKEAPKTLADEVRANRNKQDGSSGPSSGGSSSNQKFFKIVARRRDGEVEKYGFSMNQQRDEGEEGSLSLMGDSNKKATVDPELEQLVSNLRTKVVCDSVRLCNNEISDATQLLPVLRNLVVNHYLRVRWLDLSNNRLKEIPPEIAQMPLQSLHLHGNQIDSWRSIEDELPKLTRLQHLTIFGNPVAENASTFRPRALGLLLHVPFKILSFKSLDFVALTLVDVQSAAAFLRTHPKALDVTSPSRIAGGSGGIASGKKNVIL